MGVWEKLKTWEENATKREKFLVVFVSILVPIFLFYQFYYTHAKEKIDTLRKEVKKLDLEIKRYKKLVMKIKFLETQMKQRQKFLNRVKKILPSQKEIPDILKRISDVAKEDNLEVITFKPGKEIPQNYYQTIPINMEIEGRFNNVIKFLNDIESLERLIVLNNVKFQMKNNRLNAMVTFYTFKYTGIPLEKKSKEKKNK